MPSFRRRASVIDADRVEEPTRDADRGPKAERARALAEEAEAEAEEAEAAAAAARARARALRLRREADAAGPQAEATPGVEAHVDDVAPADLEADEPAAIELDGAGAVDLAEADEADGEPDASPARRRPRVPRPTWKGITATLTMVVIAGLLALSGYLIWHHRQAEHHRQLNAEYSAAARQSVVTLMSLDFTKAQEDIQRIIDNSTGQFKDDFEAQAKDFVQVAQDSKVITEVSVNSTAVQEMTDDSAIVLVAASSRVTNTAGANQEPRTWRLSVDLQREGDQLKMSKVEFVP